MYRLLICRRVLLVMTLGLLACSEEDEGASRIPPPPGQIVYDASAYDDVADARMKHYLQAADALAHDRFPEAQGALRALVSASTGQLQTLARTAAEAGDVASTRIAFKPLSNTMRTMPLPDGVVLAYCPMAFDYEGGHWVQRDGAIMNPYYGAAMLHCGVFEDEDTDSDGGA